jgi:metallo-beta-lactamase family protein
MIEFLSCQDQSQIRKVFLVHGDYPAQQFYGLQLKKAGYANIEIPEQGEIFRID